MRIGISGAQGVGKTTLLNALSKDDKFSNLKVRDEVTRWVRGLGLPINESGTDTTQLIIAQRHIYNIYMFDEFITDRTILDCLVYTEWLYKQGKVAASTLEEIQLIFKRLIFDYDYLFYIKPEFQLANDGVRSTNIDFRDDIVDLFEYHIKNDIFLNSKVITLSGSVQNRVKQVKAAIYG